LLLIGFNRPQATIQSLKTIVEFGHKFSNIDVIVSIDGPRKDNAEDMCNQIKFDQEFVKFAHKGNVTIWRHLFNLGVDTHVPFALSKVFHEFDGVIVLEDDIQFSETTIHSMANRLESSILEGNISPVIGISAISFPFARLFFFKNKWRESIYFSAWGYALTKQFWQVHESRIANPKNEENLSLDSEHWQKLPPRKKRIWTNRLQRNNYDYQIQLTMLKYGISSIVPRFRITRNLGFQEMNATNTRFKQPLFMRVKNTDHGIIETKLVSKKHTAIERFWNWLDSNTWAGDGLMSTRGRTIGLRTAAKGLLKSFNVFNKV